MKRIAGSPIPKADFESEILQQLDKIAETGNQFRVQILELGKKLKSSHDAVGQKSKRLRVESSSTSVNWMQPIETKLEEITNAQHKLSEDIRVLENRRLSLQELMAGKIEDVLKDVATLKSLNKTTMDLKPKLDEERKTIQDLESQVDKMKGELKEKLDRLESAAKSNQDIIKSSLEKFCSPPPTDSDGWILIQKRDSGPRDDFERDWTEYENGFGSVYGNFWLGLKKIHELTADGSMELRVELTDWEGRFAHANYSKFAISKAADLYRLSVSGFSGDAKDALRFHNGSQFSTKDKIAQGCNGIIKGGWWAKENLSNLNGLYYVEKGDISGPDCFSSVYWYTWKRSDQSLKKVLMKIRKRK